MTRRCSHCGRNGHNSRTCPDRGLKPLTKTDEAGGVCMRKSYSMATLSSPPPSPPTQDPPPHQQSRTSEHTDGCTSDGMAQGMAAGGIAAAALRERKKGIPWTEEEHRMFLLGLQKLGKGDWRGISRSFVTTRTPTQVASHAQKYFIRQTNLTRRKRRSSLFDIKVEGEEAEEEEEGEEGDEENHVVSSSKGETKGLIPVASPTSTAAADLVSEGLHPAILPSVATPFLPYPFPIWAAAFMSSPPPSLLPSSPSINSNVVKPTATLSTAPIKLDSANGLSRLISSRVPSSTAVVEPSPLSLKLLRSSRSSAFHASPGFASNHLHRPNKLGSGSGSAAISVVQ